MDDAVEEVRGIRAYHGMTTEDLDSAVQSGLPPLHTDGAGDISLLFRPEASLSYDTETPVQDTGFGARLSSIAGRMAGGRTADAMESSRVLLDVLSRSHTKRGYPEVPGIAGEILRHGRNRGGYFFRFPTIWRNPPAWYTGMRRDWRTWRPPWCRTRWTRI